ncbi:hypothetical protein AY633_06500 [Planococcus maritimus]|nr:hypothetical protein AY633_06500 [Planococcus maritimus]
MQINLILGNSIDSLILVRKLKNEGENSIMILDYDLLEDSKYENNVLYISPDNAHTFIQRAKIVIFHKSLYIYPGMYKK